VKLFPVWTPEFTGAIFQIILVAS